jgi:MATE family multidrug resistance protein
LNRRILQLAIPNIISNLSVPLLGAVDTAVIGHLDAVYYLGAIAVGSIIFDFIFWGFGFLRMGTTGLVAQAFGAHQTKETRIILARVLLVAFSLSILIILLQFPILKLSLLMVNASPEVEQYVQVYFSIRIFAAPATLALFGLNGWFLGMQNARFPMYVTILLNVLNIILNLVFVLKYDMNVAGVAWGSLIASYVAVGFAIWLYFRTYHLKGISIVRDELLQLDALKKFFSVNSDIFIRTLCLVTSYAFFTAKSAETGDVVLAANTILLQLWYISAYGIDGFAFAAESLVGRYFGANDRERLKEAIKGCMVWGIGIGLAGTACYALFGQQIVSVFTDQTIVLESIQVVLIWTVFAPIVNSICFIWDGVYIGATATPPMRNSMLVATVFVFIPVYYLTLNTLGVHAIWLAMFSFMLARGILLSVLAKKHIFNPLKLAA